MKRLLIIALLSIGQFVFSQAKGTVSGKLTDKDMNGEALPFANVFVKGTSIGSTTDMDGNYTISVPVGSQTIVFSFVGYKTIEKKVTIVAGKKIVINQEMGSSEGVALEEVKITGTVSKEKESALLLEQKKATVIKESIGAVELSKKGVSNAAAATTKISGVTKSEGSGDIYIRGLGDRYLSTTMNGLPIPSDDVNNKNINLNLFTTNIIQNVGISKTYSTASYSDQGSGNVDIVSKQFSKKGMKIGLSTGANTNVFAIDNFKRTGITEDVQFGFHTKKYDLETAITKQTWDTSSKSMPYNFGLSLGGGTKFNLLDKKWDFVASSSFSSSSQYTEELFRSYKANQVDIGFSNPKKYNNNELDIERFKINSSFSGYARLGVKLNDKNKLAFNSLFVNKGIDNLYEAGRKGLGFVYDQDPKETQAFVRDQNFKQTMLFVNQFMGEHKSINNTLKWAAGYNYVLAEEPNRIRNEFNFITDDFSEIQFAHVGDFQQRKSSQKINDREINAFIEDKIALGVTADEYEKKPYSLNIGANFRKKKRSFKNLFVGVKAKGFKNPSLDNITDTFTDENFDKGLQLKTQPFDRYKADLTILAAYASFDFKFGNSFSGNVGARFEMDKYDIIWDVNNYINEITGSSLGTLKRDYSSVYPSLNLKYKINEKNFFRFATSITQTLPEFKELSPFEYVSPTGRVVKGNPNLEKSDVYNIDLKWEFFPSRTQLVSASLFYKQINKPINRAVSRGSSGIFVFENTGDKATVLGLELEGRIDLLKNEDDKSLLSATSNLTFMSLNQDLKEIYRYKDVTETKLQGASDFIFNGSLSYNSRTDNPFILTLTSNYSSDKIFALGAPRSQQNRDIYYNDQIIEKAFFTLDGVISKKINRYITAKLVGKNLLNPEIKQKQLVKNFNTKVETNEFVQLYRKGSQVSLGLSLSF